MEATSEVKFIEKIEEALAAGIRTANSDLEFSFDGDNDSCEVIVFDGEHQITISTSRVEPDEGK